MSGPISRRELTEIADKQIRRAIQTVDGVGSVELNGGQARQIRVLLDAQKLTAHNFTVLDVRDALQRENIEAPGGRMITGRRNSACARWPRHLSGTVRRDCGGHRGERKFASATLRKSKTARKSCAPGPPSIARELLEKTSSAFKSFANQV